MVEEAAQSTAHRGQQLAAPDSIERTQGFAHETEVSSSHSFDQVDDILGDGNPANPDHTEPGNSEKLAEAAVEHVDAEMPSALTPSASWESQAAKQWKIAGVAIGASVLGAATVLGMIRYLLGPDPSAGIAPVQTALASEVSEVAPSTDDRPHDVAATSASELETPSATHTGTHANTGTHVSDSTGSDEDNHESRSVDENSADLQQLQTAKAQSKAVVQTSPPDANDPLVVVQPQSRLIETFKPLVEDSETVTSYKPVTQTRSIDVTARLNDPIESVDFEQIRLTDFTRFLTRLSTVPISLDALSWELARLNRHTRITVRQEKTSVGDLLKMAVDAQRLTILPESDCVTVKYVHLVNRRIRRLPHPIADLTDGDQRQALLLADYARQLISPDSWQDRGGPGSLSAQVDKLHVKQAADVHFAVHRFLERLRLSRGLSPRLPKSAPKLESRWETARDKLAMPISVRLNGRTQLLDVITAFENAGDVTLLVDWSTVVQEGIYPDTELTLSANNLPVEDSLNQFLDPLNLTFRVIDAATYQITTNSTVESQRELEFYSADKLAEGLATTLDEPSIRQALSELLEGDIEVPVVYDAKGRYIIVSATQGAHRSIDRMIRHHPDSA